MSSAKKTSAAAEKTDPTDLLDGKLIKDGLVRAGLSTKGSVLEMATRLQGHFTSDPEHVKNGSREYDCDVDAGGCGYPFPTNLDLDANVNGLTPLSQAEIVAQALADDVEPDALAETLDTYDVRHRTDEI